jgi:hypothetical protein
MYRIWAGFYRCSVAFVKDVVLERELFDSRV